MGAAPIPWLPLLAILVPLGIVLTPWLLGRLGGWDRLARRYRAPAGRRPREGQFEFIGSGAFGLGQYNGCLMAGATPVGLYLAMWFPFRVGHPPLLIPWEAIRNAETRRVFWSQRLILRISVGEGKTDAELTLYHRSLFPAIRAALGDRADPPTLPRM